MTHLENVDLYLWFDQANTDYYICASVLYYTEKWVWLCSVFLQVSSAIFFGWKKKRLILMFSQGQQMTFGMYI